MPDLIEHAAVTFKAAGPSPPDSFFASLSVLKATPGVLGVYTGEQHENPGHFDWVIRWESAAAFDAFHKSPEYPAWRDGLVSQLATVSMSLAKNPQGGDLVGALASPTVEVFTAGGVKDDFLVNSMKAFYDLVMEPGTLTGFRTGVIDEFAPAVHVGVEAPEQKVVKLLAGWESVEAHLAQRGDDKAIDLNLHLVVPFLKTADMYHVAFKKL